MSIDENIQKECGCGNVFLEDSLDPTDTWWRKFSRNAIVSVILCGVWSYHVLSARFDVSSLGEVILGYILLPFYIFSSITMPTVDGGMWGESITHLLGMSLKGILNQLNNPYCWVFGVIPILICAYLYSVVLNKLGERITQSTSKGSFVPNKGVFLIIAIVTVIVFSASFVKYHQSYHDSLSYRSSCKYKLRDVNLLLTLYANSHHGTFPLKNGMKGLEELCGNKRSYLCPTFDFNVSECEVKRDSSRESDGFITDYEYRGGLNTKMPPRIPIVWDKVGNHPDCGNVLFLNGDVEEFKGKDWIRNTTLEANLNIIYPKEMSWRLHAMT